MDFATLSLEWIAELGVTASVATAATIAAFRLLGTKWLDARFAERLEKFKHDQSQEIERLRYRINALMDRTTKLHQHEFEVLPEIWQKLGIAFSAATSFTWGTTRYPDLNAMGEAQFSEFLEGSPLSGWQKDELQNCSNRNGNYQQMMFWHRLDAVHKAHADFHNYFISKGIFVQPELKEKIRALSNMMYDAFRERETNQENPMPGEGRFGKGDRLHREGLEAMEAIENATAPVFWTAG